MKKMKCSDSPSRSASRSRLRRVLPGTTYLVTKKTNDDFFVIRSSEATDRILLYTLILKALRYGVLIHGFCFMSNHFHLVVTDVRGRLPAFMRDFLSETSKAIQVQLSDNRHVWSSTRYSAVALLDLDAAERELAYSHLNPTRAGLTAPADWPGLTGAKCEAGAVITVDRPAAYFSKRYRPAEVSVSLAPLPGVFEELSADQEDRANRESAVRVRAMVEAESRAIQSDLDRRGRRMAGRARVLSMPRSHRSSHPVRTANPRFATTNPQLMTSAVAEMRAFEDDHESARVRYVGGHPKTIFPPGTYGYRELLGVRVSERRSA